MELYQQGKEKIKPIKAKPFKLEKEIHFTNKKAGQVRVRTETLYAEIVN
jgi:hypothetical protein